MIVALKIVVPSLPAQLYRMDKPYSAASLHRLFEFPDEDMHALTKNHKRMSMALMDDAVAEVPTVITITKTNKFGMKQTRKMMFDWGECIWKVVDPKGQKVRDMWFCLRLEMSSYLFINLFVLQNDAKPTRLDICDHALKTRHTKPGQSAAQQMSSLLLIISHQYCVI